MMLSRDLILDRIEEVDNLPTFPAVIQRLEKEMSCEPVSLGRVVKIIEDDASLSALLLKVANSAFYAGRIKTTKILQAAMRLGLQEVRRLTMAAAVLKDFGGFGGRDPRRFWMHSIAVALTTEVVARRSRASLSEEESESIYVAGLLHDLGSLLLSHLFPEDCTSLADEIRDTGGSMWQLEIGTWGIEHGEAGALLARRWELPDIICNVIQYHHQPWALPDESRRLVQIVHLANFICNNQGFARTEEGFPDEFDHGSWDDLGMSLDNVPDIITDMLKEGERSETFLSMT